MLQTTAPKFPGNSHNVGCSVGHSIPIEFLIDSGSDWNLISAEAWRTLSEAYDEGTVSLYDVKKKPGDSARAYGSDTPLVASWSFHAWTEVEGVTKPRIFAKYHVVESGRKSILGRVTATRMELLQVGVKVKPPEVSAVSVEEFPAIPNFVFDFDIDHDVTPTVKAYVNIPEADRARATERLVKMEAQGIIERVREAPKWISGLSAVPKGNNDFRLVVNMVGPNKAIRRRFFKMPTLDHIRAKLHGAKVFTKLDLTSAFHHVRLGEASKAMTTFLGPDGMFRFRRLNFGVTSAPEAFQQKMEEILQGLANVIVYIDDVLVFAEDAASLRDNTAKVLAALKANNLTLNPEKCVYEKQKLDFLGHELSEKGFNISKKKVEDVMKFRRPRDTTELKSFLGLASFLSAFIKSFADVSKPLWEATRVGQFVWDSEQETAFQNLKVAIAECTAHQGFFSETDRTFLYTDASEDAVGAVLVQQSADGKYRTISFASKLLSPTERRYPQTQREALGIVWGAEHFWYYLLGRKFTIRTDAEGISFILKKDHTQTKRIMRRADAWALRMEAFNYSIEHVKGSDNIADPSSRLVEGIGTETFEEAPTPGEIMSFSLEEPADVSFSSGRVTLEEIRWHASRDDEYKEVIEALDADSWKRHLGKFKSAKHELRLMNGLLSRMGETVIPRELRAKVLAAAHRGHPGEKAMKSILRGVVWWPGMLTHVESWVRSCKACTLMSRREPPVPMQRSNLPAAVWDHIAMDFNGPYQLFGGAYILVIVDRYSRFLIARPVKSTNFGAVKAVLDDAFDMFGEVSQCESDNGPPFNGGEYEAYTKERGIIRRFSTPLDAQQNGGVETYMRLINKGMTAPSVEGGDWRRSLADTVAAHNSAVCEATGVVPDVLMFGRRLRRDLPVMLTETPGWRDEEIREKDWQQKSKFKHVADSNRSAKDSSIEVGDKVFVSRPTKRKGQTNYDPTEFTVITKRHGTLELLSPSGNLLSRTVPFVKKAPECHQTEPAVVSARQSEQADDVTGRTAPEGMPQESPAVLPPPELRRSERIRARPAHLKNYVGLLGWEI